jgi:hypothetical protein
MHTKEHSNDFKAGRYVHALSIMFQRNDTGVRYMQRFRSKDNLECDMNHFVHDMNLNLQPRGRRYCHVYECDYRRG